VGLGAQPTPGATEPVISGFTRAAPNATHHSSSVVKLALPTYTATKGAVDAMTLILAKEMRGRDITVNAVAPGPTATTLFLEGKPQQAIDNLTKMTPLERLGQPEDMCSVRGPAAGAGWSGTS